MKKYIPFLMVLLLAMSCGKTEPDTTDTDGNLATTDGVIPDTPDADNEDNYNSTTFDRNITITFSNEADASVEGDVNGIVSVSGNHVTVNNTTTEKVRYTLVGSTGDGSFKIASSGKKQAIVLNGVSLTNLSGAAINIQSGKRCFVYVNDYNNLNDEGSSPYTVSGTEDQKAVLFSEGQLIFCGEGSLTVCAHNPVGKNGITSDDYIHIMDSPRIEVNCDPNAGHGIKGKDYVRISGGKLEVTTTAAMKKGIISDDYVLIEGGNTYVYVSGGTAYDSEDAEYKGSAGVKADNYFAMTGGTLTINNTGNGGKGIHAGSYDFDPTDHKVADSYISGGIIDITVAGREQNDVSAKGIKVGWAIKDGTDDHAKVLANAGNLLIGGGKITITSDGGEGLESKGCLYISGGELSVTSKADDAINCQGQLDVTGGYVYAYSSANDAMDSNHDMVLSGGYVLAICTKGSPELGLDANSEEHYKVYIKSGATVVSYGGIESGFSAEQSVYSFSGTGNAWNALYGSGGYLCAFKSPSSGVSSFAVSAPGLSSGYKSVSVGGETFCGGAWAVGNISGGTSVTLGDYSGGGSGGPGGGFPGGGGGRPRP
ncbi:MAG: carbohydrate-binding domain-containing protein [Bacteroidales bacterium]|nr:carbohydrate-binding domain-containing protein [Bacteroidales bacterium]